MSFMLKLFAFAFGVLAVGLYLAFHAPEYLVILFSILFIGPSLLVVFGVRQAIIKGELPGRFGGVTFRHSSPIVFWFQIAIYILTAAFLLCSGLALLGLAPHWFIALLRSMHSHH